MITFSIEDPVFKVATLYVICDQDAFAAYMRQHFPRAKPLNASGAWFDDPAVCGTSFTFRGGPPWRLVWSSKVDINVILHETFHLTTRICYDRGIPIVAHHPDGQNGDETAAYILEYYMREVYKRLRVRVGRK